ncbi:MAG: hypothetical protein JRI23_15675 [Deltaproteobacteria bacterium]|jgi:uncharacterized membrane protein YhaH (DUF805 family)|nr:hypothetical protein [Deltaproteobacteria bacterium]MBW2533200.1 hypothetical protein [Deltaproteobacteria bacterium]
MASDGDKKRFDWSGWLVVAGPVVGGLLLSQSYIGRADAWMMVGLFSALYAVLQVVLLGIDSRVLAKLGLSAGGYASCGILALSLALWPVLLAVYVVYLRKRDREGLPKKLRFGIAALLVLLGGLAYGNLVFDKCEVRCELVAKGVDLVCEVSNPTPGPAHSCFQVVLVAEADGQEIPAGGICGYWLGWGESQRESILNNTSFGGLVLDQIRATCFPKSNGTDPNEAPACSVRTKHIVAQ